MLIQDIKNQKIIENPQTLTLFTGSFTICDLLLEITLKQETDVLDTVTKLNFLKKCYKCLPQSMLLQAFKHIRWK